MNLNQMKPFNLYTTVDFSILNPSLKYKFGIIFSLIEEVNFEITKGKSIEFILEDYGFKYYLYYNTKSKRGLLFKNKLVQKINSLNSEDNEEKHLKLFLLQFVAWDADGVIH
jgi:hypothetical protein